jgi:hypothetical protein
VLAGCPASTAEQITEINLKAEETRNLTLAFIKYHRSSLSKKNSLKKTENKKRLSPLSTTGE